MQWLKKGYLFCVCAGFCDLPVFMGYLSTCCNQVWLLGLLGVEKLAFYKFVSYQCLNGTWSICFATVSWGEINFGVIWDF